MQLKKALPNRQGLFLYTKKLKYYLTSGSLINP
jgi:hypothetical protein